MKTILFDLDGTITNLNEKPKLRLLIKRRYIEKLAGKYILGIITASEKYEIFDALEKLRIYGFFCPKLIISSKQKNTGIPFSQAQSRTTEIVAMIGDSDCDKEGAEKAKIPFVWAQEFKPKHFLK